MPSLDNIERFKSQVYSLAGEPEYRSKVGLPPTQEISPPDSALDEDLSELLSHDPGSESDPEDLNALASSLELTDAPDLSRELPPEDDLLGGLFEDLPDSEDPSDSWEDDQAFSDSTPEAEAPLGVPEDFDLDALGTDNFLESMEGPPSSPTEAPSEELQSFGNFDSLGDESPLEDFGDSAALLEGFSEELSGSEPQDLTVLGGDFPSGEGLGFGSDSLDQNFYSSDAPNMGDQGGGSSIVFDDLAQGSEDFGFGEDTDFGDEFTNLMGVPNTTAAEVASFDSSGDADEFALGDFSSQFGLSAEETSTEPEMLNPAESIEQEIAQSQRSLVLTDDELKALQKSLSSFPLNLRLAVEEVIGEKEPSFEDLNKLIRLLITGGSLRSVASLAGKLLGKTIKIPPGYAKGTGEALESSRFTLSYLAQVHMWPVLRGFLAATVAISLILVLGYNFLFMPFRADSIYKEGYQAILQGNSELGDRLFNDAWRRWATEDWVFKYADAHAAMGEYERAQNKYGTFLKETVAPDPVSGSKRTYFLNYNKRGLLAYHQLIAEYGYDGLNKTAHFEKAEAILDPIFQRDHKDPEALLAKGDLYAQWAQVDGTKVDQAMSTYAEYSLYHGEDNEVAYRRLKIYMLTDNEKMVMTYRAALITNPSMKIPPRVVAQMAGWILDRESQRRLSETRPVLEQRTLEEELNPLLLQTPIQQTRSNYLAGLNDILFNAQKEDPSLPDIHYELARFFRMIDSPLDEEKALGATDYYFQVMDPILAREPQRIALHIDTLDRIGEVFFRKQEPQQAVKYFLEAKRRYEDALAQNVLKPQEDFGRIYSNLAGVYYETSTQDWALAGELYALAEQNLYVKPEQTYKIGVIHYALKQYGKAIDRFYKTENTPGLETNKNNLYSLANSLYRTGNYFGAMGYYKLILQELSKAAPVTKTMAVLKETKADIERDQVDRASLAEVIGEMEGNDKVYLKMLVQLWNNLGVSALKSRGGRRQNSAGFVEASGYLSRAQILSDALGRNGENMERGDETMIAINIRNMIGNWSPENLEIYGDLPRTPWSPWF